jgi:hypothetical protein
MQLKILFIILHKVHSKEIVTSVENYTKSNIHDDKQGVYKKKHIIKTKTSGNTGGRIHTGKRKKS